MGIRVRSAHSWSTSLRLGLLALLLATSMGLAAVDAGAASHPTVTGEYGKEGPAASGIGSGCSIAFNSYTRRLVLASDEKVYGLELGAPGSAAPLGANFPIAADNLTACGDADVEVDNTRGASAGNIYLAGAYPPKVSGWDWAGSPLGGAWPVTYPDYLSCALAMTGTGDLWVARYYQEKGIDKRSASGDPLGAFFPGFNVCKMAIDPVTNDLYVVDLNGSQLVQYKASNNYKNAKEFPNPNGQASMAVNGRLGRLYVHKGAEIAVYDTTTAALLETIPTGGFAGFGGNGIALDEATDTVFATVGYGASGVIKEWAGVPVPKAVTGDPVGDTEVTGTADPSGVGPITECYFEFGLDQNSYDSKQDCEESLPIVGTQNVHANLPEVFGDVTYHYRLVLGNGAPDAVGKGFDRAITPSYIEGLQTEAATEIERTTAALNASFEGSGEDVEYYFEYGTTTDYGSETAPDNTGAVSGATPITGAATSLVGGTTYHFRAVVTNGQGTSKSPDMTFTTAAAVASLQTEPATEVTTNSAKLNGSLDPDGFETTYYFEYGKTLEYGNTVPAPPGTSAGTTAPGVITVGSEVQGLEPGTVYHYRIVAANSTGSTTATNDETFETREPPEVESFTSSNVARETATLEGTINPNGEETTYRFEYGITPDYELVAPVPDGTIATATTGQDVTVELTDLQPVTYHFRLVATSKWGTTASPDQTFTFYPTSCPNSHLRQQTGAGYLPDCRAYELVSPGDIGSAILFPQAPYAPQATNPSRFAFSAAGGAIPNTGDPQNVESDVYISTRRSSGWVTKYVGRRGNEGTALGALPHRFGLAEGVYVNLDMDKLLEWDHGSGPYVCCGDIGSYAPYVWDVDNNDPLGRLPTNLDEIPFGTIDANRGGFFGDGKPSPDFSHYIFSSNNQAFVDGGLEVAPGSVYDNDVETGELTIVSKIDNEGVIEDIPQDPNGGTSREFIEIPGVSTDGSHILMSTEVAGQTHLYMTVDDDEYFEPSLGEDGINHGVKFIAMTDDGENVYFTAPDQLTADDQDTSVDLYVWSLEPTPTLKLVSRGEGEAGNSDDCSASWATKCGVEVVNVNSEFKFRPTDNALAAESGEIYFYSPELLESGKGVAGQRNFYVYRDGQPRFVATLTNGNTANRIQVSPDGDNMAFVSAERLTSYDNAGHRVMYWYRPATKALVCVSCIPDGTPPLYDVEGSRNGLFMSDDGRTFFSSKDALVEKDSNGLWDAYEFVESRPQLISSGTANADQGYEGHAGLIGVSADGIDVYFATLDTLVPQDVNGPFYKFYDARAGGGIPFAPEPAPCAAGDECHGPSSQPPTAPSMSTGADLGESGSVATQKKKKSKKKAKKKKRKKHKRNDNRKRGGRR